MLFNRSSFLVFIVVCFIGILNGKDIPVSTHNVTVTIAASGFYENSSSTTDDKPLLSTPGIAVVHTTPEVSSGSSSVASTLPHTAKWNVTQDGSVCILFQSGIRITFNYTVKATNESKIGFADVPSEAISTGVCDAEVQVISLIFYDNWNLTFTFIRNNTEYFISSAALSYKLLFGHQPFPEAKDFISSSVHHINEYGDFKSEVGKSSVCTSQFTLLNEAEPNSIGLLSANLYDTRVEAFRGNVSDTDFSVVGNRCSNDEISILIPIIVGACLAGLIVVVLVAYVIGRHRTKRGYLNV